MIRFEDGREKDEREPMERMNRRDFLKISGITGGALFLGIDGGKAMSETKSSVAFVKTENRRDGIKLSPVDEKSREDRNRIREILKKG